MAGSTRPASIAAHRWKGARAAGTRSIAENPGPAWMAASALEGETVLDIRGETLGEIEEIMLDVPGGRITCAVLAVGGFLGIGEKYVPVPWPALTLDTDRQCFVLGLDRETLADAPAFDRDRWLSLADPEWAAAVDAFYNRES